MHIIHHVHSKKAPIRLYSLERKYNSFSLRHSGEVAGDILKRRQGDLAFEANLLSAK